jgi:hypothetical protein
VFIVKDKSKNIGGYLKAVTRGGGKKGRQMVGGIGLEPMAFPI